jgi:dGTPase
MKSVNRFYNEEDRAIRVPSKGGDYRSQFQIDRDRIIHSGAFRRLQSKTQVFMSGEYDFYRTRLTHSIEVAQIGRSITTYLLNKSEYLNEEYYIDHDLVESICLAHDLGHPAFGHTGESTLHELMKPYGGFEGNAQTLRLLTATLFSDSQSGMNPSRSLVDGVLKYKTLWGEVAGQKNHYLYPDQKEWLDFVLYQQEFPAELNPGKIRNQFKSIECQIMDWADDTAYCLNDLADAIQAGFITLTKVRQWAANQQLTSEESAHIEWLCCAIQEAKVEPSLNRMIGRYIQACQLVPEQNFLSDRSQRHCYRLEIDPQIKVQSKINKRLAMDLVFRSPQLQQLDFKADMILRKLFTVLEMQYVQSKDVKKWNLLPAGLHQNVVAEKNEGQRARLICDWLAGMTDRFALKTYRRLFDADYGSMTDLV